MVIQSKALEVNIADYHVEVEIDPKYAVIQQVLSKYYGIMDGLNTFLEELAHPYKNWHFIVEEARNYSLDYFHLLKQHPEGPAAAGLFVDIFTQAIAAAPNDDVRTDAVDNLLLFLQKIIKDAGGEFTRFFPAVNEALAHVEQLTDEVFFLFVKSYYQINKMAELVIEAADAGASCDPSVLNRTLARYFRHTYRYWLDQQDPHQWFCRQAEIGEVPGLEAIFEAVSVKRLKQLRRRLQTVVKQNADAPLDLTKALVTLEGFKDIAAVYRQIPPKLLALSKRKGQGYHWKVLFLFHISNLSGLAMIHEEALREINRTSGWLIKNQSHRLIHELIRKTFTILNKRIHRFPTTALNCVLNMGRAVYKTDDSDLINFFITSMVDLGFQAPMVGGVGNDWQVKVNLAHIQNIRTWLSLVELNPKWSTRLLSDLIVHLALSGVYVKDTDLFPRDVTRLLNSDITPVYNLVKQLTRMLPVFFNDIGAEGKLREISTEFDEITRRKDVLIHFLRKQSHVESSNRIVGFMEATLEFWRSGDKDGLEPYVPPNIFQDIALEGPFIDGVKRVMRHLQQKGVNLPGDLLCLADETLDELLDQAQNVSDTDRRRVILAVTLYKLLTQKYQFDFIEIDQYLAQLRTDDLPDLKLLRHCLTHPVAKRKLTGLLEYLTQLRAIILSPQQYEIREDIYKKRHFAVDIPSMYGSYNETKFNALGLTYRIESLVNVLFEQQVENIDLNLVTKATFFQIFDLLVLFDQALKVDGIASVAFERQLDLLAHSLEVKEFSFTQYLDIFKGFARAVKNIISDHFNNMHEQTLARILPALPAANLLPRFLPQNGPLDSDSLNHRVSEIFFRDRIALSLGLQQLDRFLSRILNILFDQSYKLPKNQLQLLLNYDPKRAMTAIFKDDPRISSIIYLGNKGSNLVRLKKLGLPVPPGFIISTEVFRCQKIIDVYEPAKENLKEQVYRQIARTENDTGKRFGDPANPLLLSVRSGSSISQPGMMDTFLNVGNNEKIAAGIARKTGNEWFAWDNYRRFLQCYGMAFGLNRDDFDSIISEHKIRRGIPLKRGFRGEQMKEVALAYKTMIRDNGIEVLEDPLEQLFLTIKKVLASWESAKARTYRRIMGISDDWGTAVTVQAMVYGNVSRQSGSGVFFTHNPRWSGDSLRLWGDFTIGNQGEDVVAGLVQTLPISIIQQDSEMRDTDITLESHFPEVYDDLKKWASHLIFDKGWSPQEMEFTFEGPSVKDLYILQTRDMSMRARKKAMIFDPAGIETERPLGHGIGVSGGAMSGRAIFSLDEIDYWRKKEPDTSLILVRGDTVPDDIQEIHAADGLVTARGGLTSHAAVVAHRLGKTCVVGCGNLVCREKQKTFSFNGQALKTGDFISIDGQEGSVFHGRKDILMA